MKPLHVGLLVVGAALAGGLAVKMTGPLAIPQAPAAAAPAPVAPPAVQPVSQPKPAVAIAPEPKPSPIPAPPVARTAAPQPVYLEPAKPAIRKNEPISIVAARPTQWIPAPYKALPRPVQPVPSPATAPEPAPSPEPQNAPSPRHVTLRAGMTIAVRLDESLSSDKTAAGDTFQASLAEPLVVDGLVIAERGARVTGKVIDAQTAGRVRGTSSLELGLATLRTSDGQQVPVSTDPWTKLGAATYSQDAEKIGGGAALGAIIGAIAGGGKGAAIGAGAGGVLGAGTAMATRAKSVNVPSETVIRFRLSSRITVTEQQIAGR